MTSWAKPGVKCVCIDDFMPTIPPPAGYESWGDDFELVAGTTYTIRDRFFDTELGFEVVRLAEIYRPLLFGESFEAGFLISRFRPIVTKTQEQDVALFKAILTSVPETV